MDIAGLTFLVRHWKKEMQPSLFDTQDFPALPVSNDKPRILILEYLHDELVAFFNEKQSDTDLDCVTCERAWFSIYNELIEKLEEIGLGDPRRPGN